MMKIKIHKLLAIFMNFMGILIFASCVTLIPPASATSSGPRTIIIDGKTINAEDADGFTTWICTDFLYEEKIFLEVGFFGNPTYRGLGFILFDGGYYGEFTHYQRTGVEHRWDWGPNGNDYAFVIKPDGTGLYFDFSVAETAKARSVYKCYQRKTPIMKANNN